MKEAPHVLSKRANVGYPLKVLIKEVRSLLQQWMDGIADSDATDTPPNTT